MGLKIFFSVLVISGFCFTAAAQGILIKAPEAIDSMVQAQIEKNKTNNSVSGFRVQVMQTPDRKKANDAKTSLLEKNPEMDVYIIYQAPNYKVRVGNYIKRIECVNIYKILLADFPQSFVVPDKIELPEL